MIKWNMSEGCDQTTVKMLNKVMVECVVCHENKLL